MVLSFFRTVMGVVVLLAIAFDVVPAYAAELAVAQGAIAISEARPGLRAPLCSELVVEARDALDNRLISDTRPTTDESGICRYALTVPAQTAVWLHVQPLLVAGARVVNNANENVTAPRRARPPSSGIALRFTIVASTTYFFSPNERKVVPLAY